jgi:hypothetical protein
MQVVICAPLNDQGVSLASCWNAVLACYDERSTIVPRSIASAETEAALVVSVEDFLDAAEQYQQEFFKAVMELGEQGMIIKGLENAKAFHERDLRPAPEQLSTLLIGGRYYGASCFVLDKDFNRVTFQDVLEKWGMEESAAKGLVLGLEKYRVSDEDEARHLAG